MADLLLGRALVRLSAWLFRRAARVVVVHARERDTLLKLNIPAHTVSVIPHGIDIARFETEAQTAPASTLPRRPGRSVALYLGTIGRVHGLAALVRAATDDRICGLPVDFVIIGDGECRAECLGIAEDAGGGNISFLSPVPLDQVPSILKQADILICSHRRDAYALLGSKFCEYCAAGKPILVHGRSLAAQLVEQIGSGLACSPGDPEGLHAALADFISRSEFWRDRGLRGCGYVQRYFSQSERDMEWETLLKSIVKKRK